MLRFDSRLNLCLLPILFATSITLASPDGTSTPQATDQAPSSSAIDTVIGNRDDFSVPEGVTKTPDAFRFQGTYVSAWPKAAASAMALNVSNTIPYLIPPTEPFEQGINVWDAWPVRTPDGAVASFDGWVVLVGLSSELDSAAEFPFYTRSTWRYWYARDDRWLPGGVIFSRKDALGSRQWAGSTVYDRDSDKVLFYYTAVGAPDAESLKSDEPTRMLGRWHPGAGRPNTEQRMAVVEATITAGPNGVAFDAFSKHRLLLEADGDIYVTESAFVPGEVIYGMRDPHYWQDPASGREYLLFTANAAGFQDPYNGAVGIAEKRDGQWVLQRPLIAAPGVSSQLERPHVVVRDDGLYVFFSTHAFTFADGISGPEGLYGFYNADGDIHGHFEPVNGTGLVLGNPPASPVQAYSFLVLPDGKVMSYINTPFGHSKDPEAVREFVGAPAPMVQIGLKAGKSYLLNAPDTRLSVQQ